MGEFDGKVVFITGIARGQGRNHALRFAREGASIIGIDIAKPVTEYATYEQATEDDFHETVRSVEEAGGKIVARIGDVRDSAALKAVVDEGVAQFGRLDVVVANAGICTWSRFWEMPDDQFEELIDINLTGVFKTLKAAAPAMIEAATAVPSSSSARLQDSRRCPARSTMRQQNSDSSGSRSCGQRTRRVQHPRELHPPVRCEHSHGYRRRRP